ncbi:hypothetical protein ETB55_21705 [Salmonella enterica subsp. enterica serovar Omuna]|nr:hypothetical protein [Salmonella enterica subsp. enterica serovar Omuna]
MKTALEALDGNELESYALFLAEDRDIEHRAARRLAAFMLIAKNIAAFDEPVIFTKNGLERVYFRLWSQNKLPAMDFLDKIYFDAADCDVHVKMNIFGTSKNILFSDINRNHSFSGARTREVIFDAMEELKWLKDYLE